MRTKWNKFRTFLGEIVQSYEYLLIYIAVITTATLVWVVVTSN